jgi:hypothetical protein
MDLCARRLGLWRLRSAGGGVLYSRDRGGEHPEQHLAGYAGLMQATAYAGFNRLYDSNRNGGSIIDAACWAHAVINRFIAETNPKPFIWTAKAGTRRLRGVTMATPTDRLRMARLVPKIHIS